MIKGAISRKAMNFPIQGTGADMLKLAAIKLYRHILADNLWGIVLIPCKVHDEIISECPEELTNKYANIIQDSMESAGKIFCSQIPMPAKPIISDRWAH